MQNQTKMKYAWDITTERDFSTRQMNTINQISEMISNGGNVAELKKKLRLVSLL